MLNLGNICRLARIILMCMDGRAEQFTDIDTNLYNAMKQNNKCYCYVI